MKHSTGTMQVVREAMGIVFLAVILALGTNALRSDGIGVIGSTDSGSVPDPPVAGGAPASIGIETAIALFNRDDAVFVDARPAADYRQGHIKGARNLPDHTFDQWIADFMAETPPDVRLITYCAGESCHLSADLAEKLQMAGYERATHLVDGWGKWRAAGMPTERGPSQ